MIRVVRSALLVVALIAVSLVTVAAASAQEDGSGDVDPSQVEEFIEESAPPPTGPQEYQDVIVTLVPGSPLFEFVNSLEAQGAEITNEYQSALTGFAGSLPTWVVELLQLMPDVVTVEPDVAVSIAAQPVPPGIDRIGADENAEIDVTDGIDERVAVDVAIIDTGLSTTHPDLNVVSTVSMCTANCSPTGEDQNGHGTHVGGTVGALDNNIGVVGVAPGARLHGVQVLGSNGSGTMASVIDGVDYVTDNAADIEVINMSLSCICSVSAFDTAVANAVDAGVVVVVAAGNDDEDAEATSPANHPDVITVSAMASYSGFAEPGVGPICNNHWNTTHNRLATFSNFGPYVDIAAPGVCVNSTTPGGDYSQEYSGTSMASPHVAGAAALLASRSKPVDGAGVANVKNALLLAGTDNWVDTSNDGFKEPLLNVSDPNVFDPVFVGGVGGGSGPNAEFNADPTSGPIDLDVNFTDASTGPVDSWSWTFGDGGTSTDQNPSHTYTAPGTYTVELTVDGPAGTDTENKANLVTVTGPPVAPDAEFSESSTGGDAPLIVDFTDASTGSVDSWSWTFGDGGTSTDQSPSHTYTAPGTYTVELTVDGPAGTDTETKSGLITVSAPPVTYCSASASNQAYEFIDGVQVGGLNNPNSGPSSYSDFTGQTANLSPGETVSVALTPGFPGSSYTEHFAIWIDYDGNGDFNGAGEQVFTGSGSSIVSGSFNVPSDAFGTTLMRVGMQWNSPPDPCGSITYGEIEDYTVQLTATPVVSDFSASPNPVGENTPVSFTDLSTNGPTSWSWTFGDGETSTLENPSHSYTSAGIYTVSLTATNAAGGDTETKDSYIEVEAEPVAAFTAGPTSGDASLLVNFTDTSTNDPTSWSWTFGDGGTSTLENPSHTYTAAGIYTVSLTATNAGGSDTETKTGYITVVAAPVAEFSASPNPVGENTPVTFTDLSTNGPTSWSWTFGDGETSTLENPSHSYTSAGIYTVSLTATNAAGGDTETKDSYIEVEAEPVAAFTAGPTSGDASLLVNFTDTSTNDPTSWSWTFGDGGTSTLENPSHTYTAAGIYTVSLTATNAGGSDTATEVGYITVDEPPAPPVSYCAASGANQTYEYIDGVSVGGFSNSGSGPDSYSDFTGMTVNLTPGANTNITLTPEFPGSSYTEFWSVWIDYNRDGDFTDTGEQVYTGSSSTEITSSFNVQAGATGSTRMRVAMQWNSTTSPCDAFNWGEVEDYTVVFS